MTIARQRREFLRGSLAIPLVALGFSWPAFGASSDFAVITPQNDAEHAFLVEAQSDAAQPDRTRIRITWLMNESQQVWLVVCDKPQLAEELNLRPLIWGETNRYEPVISIRRLERHRIPRAETERVQYAYVEITLRSEQMARSYIYIDYPHPVDDGGYSYLIDLAYYLDGPLGKKSEIFWEK